MKIKSKCKSNYKYKYLWKMLVEKKWVKSTGVLIGHSQMSKREKVAKTNPSIRPGLENKVK